MAPRKTIKRFSGCFSKSSGNCQGPIVGHWITRIGNVEIRYEVCAGHSTDLMKAALVNQLMRKGFAAIGMRFPKEAPRFEFKYLSRRG